MIDAAAAWRWMVESLLWSGVVFPLDAPPRRGPPSWIASIPDRKQPRIHWTFCGGIQLRGFAREPSLLMLRHSFLLVLDGQEMGHVRRRHQRLGSLQRGGRRQSRQAARQPKRRARPPALSALFPRPEPVVSRLTNMDVIQGEWKPEGAVFNSEIALGSTGVISVSGDKYTLMLGGKPYLYRFKLYPDRKPKEFDVW